MIILQVLQSDLPPNTCHKLRSMGAKSPPPEIVIATGDSGVASSIEDEDLVVSKGRGTHYRVQKLIKVSLGRIHAFVNYT